VPTQCVSLQQARLSAVAIVVIQVHRNTRDNALRMVLIQLLLGNSKCCLATERARRYAGDAQSFRNELQTYQAVAAIMV
jgi:hypothetical protein